MVDEKKLAEWLVKRRNFIRFKFNGASLIVDWELTQRALEAEIKKFNKEPRND